MLEAAATGLTPDALVAELAAPSTRPVPEPDSVGRRGRPLADGRGVLVHQMAGKLLHAWLQNRHQTLFPLAVNLRSLSPDHAGLLAQWMAIVVLGGSGAGDAAQAAAARDWLGSVGADAAVVATFDAALQTPPPLHVVLAALSLHDLAAYGYVLALVGLDRHDPVAEPFLDYVAARLALPTTVVRSAVRRYRR
jgi:uncharacterized membrane protein YebE (DUF533 family)